MEALVQVWQGEGDYPPLVDVDGTDGSLERWLFDGEVLARYVAVIDGQVVGHVLLHSLGEYLVSRCERLGMSSGAGWIEVGKLFVRPDQVGQGIGTALLTAAREYAAGRRKRLVLCVVETSEAAHALYLREGLVEMGEFAGVHGRNVVMTTGSTVNWEKETAAGLMERGQRL
jgi:GNAT superfamily N-acetyltransferase